MSNAHRFVCLFAVITITRLCLFNLETALSRRVQDNLQSTNGTAEAERRRITWLRSCRYLRMHGEFELTCSAPGALDSAQMEMESICLCKGFMCIWWGGESCKSVSLSSLSPPPLLPLSSPSSLLVAVPALLSLYTYFRIIAICAM